jgi:hypothetical protein
MAVILYKPFAVLSFRLTLQSTRHMRVTTAQSMVRNEQRNWGSSPARDKRTERSTAHPASYPTHTKNLTGRKGFAIWSELLWKAVSNFEKRILISNVQNKVATKILGSRSTTEELGTLHNRKLHVTKDYTIMKSTMLGRTADTRNSHMVSAVTARNRQLRRTELWNNAVYEIISKNMVAPEGPQMTLQHGAYELHAG